ncbi:MAG: hypothetical protein ABI347_09400 [Nitrososphaera sp.]|jgi:hypothetical protein
MALSTSFSGSDEDSELILIDEEKAFDRAAAHYVQNTKPKMPLVALTLAQAVFATFMIGVSLMIIIPAGHRT